MQHVKKHGKLVIFTRAVQYNVAQLMSSYVVCLSVYLFVCVCLFSALLISRTMQHAKRRGKLIEFVISTHDVMLSWGWNETSAFFPIESLKLRKRFRL